MNNKHVITTNFYLNRNYLKDNYDKFNRIGNIYYPVKSNSDETVIKEINKMYGKESHGFLIAYISHYKKLKSLGIEPAKMLVSSVLMDSCDTKYLYEQGVRAFTFDDKHLLEKFLEYANPQEVKVAIRLNISEVTDTFSHLGASVLECTEMLDLLNKKGISNYGISFYLQAELFTSSNPLIKMIEFIRDNFKTQFKFIDIGGGVDPDKIDVDAMKDLLREMKIDEVIVEPGRYFVGNAGFMETRIIRKKQDNIFILQNGIYTGFLDAKLVNKQFDLYASINGQLVKLYYEKGNNRKELILCGNSNDSIDIIGTLYIDEYCFDKLKEGTIILVKDALTYVGEFFNKIGGDVEVKYNIIDSGYIEQMDESDIIKAHILCSENRDQLSKVSKCGCFYCLKIFNPKEIKTWCDNGETAVCPYCGIDSIIYDNKYFPVETQFLEKMKKHWFGDL